MKKILDILIKDNTYKKVKNTLSTDNKAHVSGLWGSSWAYFVSTLAYDLQNSEKRKFTLLFITDSIIDAEESIYDIDLFLPDCSTILPPLEIVDNSDIDDDYSRNVSLIDRMKVLHKLLNLELVDKKKKSVKNKNDDIRKGDLEGVEINIIVTSVHALMQEMPDPKEISGNTMNIEVGKEYKLDELEVWMLERGFERASQVELQGEFSLRGGIIDVFPFSSEEPFRIEFFDDDVDSIRQFDVESQMSKCDVKSCQILAVKNKENEFAKSSKGSKASIIEYLSADTLIVFKNIDSVEEKADTFIPEPGMSDLTCSYDKIKKALKKFKKLYISTLLTDVDEKNITGSNKKGEFTVDVKSLERFSQGLAPAMAELKLICSEGKKTIVLCNNEAEEHRFKELLKSNKIKEKSIDLMVGRLASGFQYVELELSILTYNAIFKRYEQRKTPKSLVKGRPLDSFLDLNKRDLVVHVVHGIARFKGIKELETLAPVDAQAETDAKFSEEGSGLDPANKPDNKREYLVLEFAEGTIVYVPATNIDLVQKYIGPSEHKPQLSKIGSKSWDRKKAQTRKAVTDMAHELINLQAVRASAQRVAYQKDDEWQKEFEAAFIYQETEDQLIVANEIRKDIESTAPMDRLVCGDVGYGKTELAMRAAFKIVMNSKQVAVLVPTTILAQQHYRTFTERMADYPVKIDVLSRFRTKKEQKEILEKAAEGSLDIIIGTHRLVQKDVFFKDIGLVVIDEEQKFGVAHKEKFKKLRHVVDVLTLTATPIPRTLHMSMLGLRDISSINTPPLDRKSIQTRIIRFKPDLIRQIIVHELNRSGQIFFVHNRVHNIEKIAATIMELVPEARVLIGHGQMNEKLLEQRMREFVDGEADILISTTIIESGVDIPNVNTIIINDAHTFGLADLHQLRGRVGRYKHRAYAYLVLPSDRKITPEAEKKVKAIEEFSNLGAGFKIALRDLEIRGAGNFLGSEQHGYIASVGYEMYCSMLEMVVKRLKNQPLPVQINVSVNININAHIPNDYISDYAQKIEVYRNLNRLQKVEEVKDVTLMIKDRYGKPPKPVENLLLETEVRIAAYHAAIRSISNVNGTIILRHMDQNSAAEGLFAISKSLRFINDKTIHFLLPNPKMNAEQSLNFLKEVLIGKNDNGK